MWRFLLFKFGQLCVNILPLKISYFFACFISDMHFYLSAKDREAVRGNLKLILPQESCLGINKKTRNVFRNFGRYLVEFFRMKRHVSKSFIDKKIKIHNMNRIDEVLKKGRGAILLTAHIGNWELGAAVLSSFGYSLLAIALPHKESIVNNLFNEQRQSTGVHVVPVQFAIRKCLEQLKSNKIVAILGDRDFNSSGEILDFFGKKVSLPKGTALLSIKTQAAIIPSFLIRQEDDTFSLIVEQPIYPEIRTYNDVEKEGIVSLMKKYSSVLERQIRLYPDQWIMFRRFWIDD